MMYMYMYLQSERYKHTPVLSACIRRGIYKNHTHKNTTGVNIHHIQNHNG